MLKIIKKIIIIYIILKISLLVSIIYKLFLYKKLNNISNNFKITKKFI
jgi:hypothetical protein